MPFEKGDFAGNTNTLAFAKYIAGFRYEDLPREVIVKIKQHILDTLGCMVAGSQLRPGQLMIDFTRRNSGQGDSTVIGSDFTTSPVLAALSNGTSGHADEVDDLHHPSIMHPGVAVLPTALALAESQKTDGKAFIAGTVLGYELVGRVARALNVTLLRKNNHSALGIPPCMASTAVASHMLGLDETQICSALGLGMEQASGTYAWLTDSTHEAKAFILGVANRNGTTAALLAQSGFHGPAAPFDQPYSIFDAFSSGERRLEELTGTLGTEYNTLNCTIKKYPIGGPIQAPVEGLLQIMKENDLRGDDIQEVVIGTNKESVWLVGKRPIQDICMEHMIGAAAHFGQLGWDETHTPGKLKHPKVLEISERVKFIADPAMEDTFPRIRAASIAVTTKSGATHKVVIHHVPGTPGNPFSQEQIEAKFSGLVTPAFGAERTKDIIKTVAKLEELKDIRELGRLLRLPQR